MVEPDLFRAVVAIAPVTELATRRHEARNFCNFRRVRDFVGTGCHIREGSPAQNAERIRVPVLPAHGGMDFNVSIAQSRLMASRLSRANVPHRLIEWDRLDHGPDDSDARAKLLEESGRFLADAMR